MRLCFAVAGLAVLACTLATGPERRPDSQYQLLPAKTGHVCIHDRVQAGTNTSNSHVNYEKHKDTRGVATRAWERLRIHLDWSEFDRNAGSNEQRYFKNVVFDQAVRKLEDSLRVVRPNGNLKYSRFCESAWQTPDQECFRYQPTPRCGEVSVPRKYLDTQVEYQCQRNGKPACEKTLSGGDGVDADFVVFVTTGQGCGSGTLAFASSCSLDQNNRPVFGRINWCQQHLRVKSTDSEVLEDIKTAMHELSHALGFSASLFQKSGVTTRTFRESYNGNTRDVVRVTSPKVVAAVREHFGCSSLAGAEIEMQGGSGTAGSHWDKRVFYGEYMEGQSTPNIHSSLSKITLSLFEDTGHYMPNYNEAEHLPWGSDQGCSFANGPCIVNGVPQEGFCAAFDQDTCSALRSGIGYCQMLEYQSALPNEFQYFSSSTTGGEQLTDFCPLGVGWSNRVCGDASAEFGNDQYKGMTFGTPESMCFKATLTDRRYRPFGAAGCYEQRCETDGLMSIKAKGKSFKKCGDATDLSFDGYNGVVSCPSAAEQRRLCGNAFQDNVVFSVISLGRPNPTYASFENEDTPSRPEPAAVL